MASHVQVPAQKEKNSYKGEKEVGKTIVNEESMGFHWLNYCQKKRGGLRV